MTPGPTSTGPARSLTVAVTGAGGKTGRHVVRAVTEAGHHVRALLHDAARQAAFPASPRTATVVGDQTRVDDVLRLVTGCDVAYHIAPNMSPAEQPMAAAMVEACIRAGVPRVIYHSVLHPQLQDMPHHWNKLRVEEELLRCGLDVVLLQPAPYMQNLEPYLRAARSGEPTPFPYGPHVALSMVDLADVGAAATAVLTGEQHVGGTYQLCAADRLTQGDAWARACAALDLDAPYRSIRPDRWRATAGAEVPEPAATWLFAMFAYYEQHGLRGSSLPLTQLLGRAPRTFADYLEGLAAGGGP